MFNYTVSDNIKYNLFLESISSLPVAEQNVLLKQKISELISDNETLSSEIIFLNSQVSKYHNLYLDSLNNKN